VGNTQISTPGAFIQVYICTGYGRNTEVREVNYALDKDGKRGKTENNSQRV
jgi:hypothetical protein